MTTWWERFAIAIMSSPRLQIAIENRSHKPGETMRVALGLKARTGRAILVAVGGSPDLQVLERSEMRLLPEGAMAPYHAAEGLPSRAAQKSVERDIAAARRLAEQGIRSANKSLTAAGHAVCGCGVLIGDGMPAWSTDEIIAVHVRMHHAEGELFRNVLVHGGKACGLSVVTLPEKTAFDAAAHALGISRSELDSRLAALGKTIGPPWANDQKQAAAVALVALASGG
jgi:hypothetical protein